LADLTRDGCAGTTLSLPRLLLDPLLDSCSSYPYLRIGSNLERRCFRFRSDKLGVALAPLFYRSRLFPPRMNLAFHGVSRQINLSCFNVVGGQTSSGMISKGKVSRTVSSHGEISHLAPCCAAQSLIAQRSRRKVSTSVIRKEGNRLLTRR
jgi:hypothetical protein